MESNRLMKYLTNLCLFISVSLLLSACDKEGLLNTGVKDKTSAYKEIIKLSESVDPSYKVNNVRANIKLTKTNLLSMLPNLTDYPLHTRVQDSKNIEVVEIFTSSEKAGSKRDGVYVDMANQFNALSKVTTSGKKAVIVVRKIASGLGAQFMLSGTYIPDAYSPSNALWVKMLNASGIKTKTILEVTAPNTAGVVVKKSMASLISNDNGDLDVSKLLTSVSSGDFAMGYTNPYQSSTGLNFLITILDSFSQGDESQYLSPDVSSALTAFQGGVPFNAQNTLQMREATLNSDVLDGFVMEYQTFINASGLSEYIFIPFGIRHDSPLIATPEADDSEREVLSLFATFLASKSELLSQYGFGKKAQYKSSYTVKDSAVIAKAQALWKQRKSGGKPIAAIFVADVSGSMEGVRIKALKKALVESADLISANNAIGLITFSNVVNVDLPIKPYKVQQKSLFIGAVENLTAAGKTATIDATAVALAELIKFSKSNPEHKLIVFLLSDGERTTGMSYSEARNAFEYSAIPIHTIAYELDSDELKDMASLSEGAYIKSTVSSASYRIGNLLNSEM